MLYSIFASHESMQVKLILILAIALASYFAIILHEISHGLVASWQGDNTARQEGRLTLNPMKHLDIAGFLMMLCVGIGWARPVPINVYNFRNTKRGIFFTAIAGVATNFILATISFILLVVCTPLYATETLLSVFLSNFLVYSVSFNLGLIAFNLLPIFPLDGFRIVESFTRYNNRFCVFMRRWGAYIFIGLFVLGYVADFVGLPQLDILGTYMNFVRNIILKFYNVVLGWFGI